jgi:hypothetical protein
MQIKKKTASSRDEIHEENCWFYTLGPQKERRNLKKNLKLPWRSA